MSTYYTEVFLRNHSRKPQSAYEKYKDREEEKRAILSRLREHDSSTHLPVLPAADRLSPDLEQDALTLQRQLLQQQRALRIQPDQVQGTGAGLAWLETFVRQQRQEKEGDLESDDADESDSDDSEAAHMHSHSRFRQEYKEICKLGKGGGGEVVKVCLFGDDKFGFASPCTYAFFSRINDLCVSLKNPWMHRAHHRLSACT
jgi:hypothetical protein